MEHARPKRRDPKEMERFILQLTDGVRTWKGIIKDPTTTPVMRQRATRLVGDLESEIKHWRRILDRIN